MEPVATEDRLAGPLSSSIIEARPGTHADSARSDRAREPPRACSAGKTMADIQVFESTRQPGSFAVTADAIIPRAQRLRPAWARCTTRKQNAAAHGVLPAGRSVRLPPPDGAQLGDVSAMGAVWHAGDAGQIDKGQKRRSYRVRVRPARAASNSYKPPDASNAASSARPPWPPTVSLSSCRPGCRFPVTVFPRGPGSGLRRSRARLGGREHAVECAAPGTAPPPAQGQAARRAATIRRIRR